jgi:hypothetical protein
LPAEIASVHFGESQSNKIRESIWATACGLSLLGFDSNEESRLFGRRGGVLTSEGGSVSSANAGVAAIPQPAIRVAARRPRTDVSMTIFL